MISRWLSLMDQTKKKILIIDDDLSLSQIFADKLTASNFSVLVAKDGQSGLRLAFSECPDLIFLDIIMPEMSGFEVLKTIRDNDWGKTVPVFMLTNLDQTEKISEAMSSNVSGYFVKGSVELEEIVRVAKSILGLTS